jgi:two-component system, OmpR family, KDP operon response regulator KdpE
MALLDSDMPKRADQLRVLAVDDEAAVLRTIEMSLVADGCQVATASSAEQALSILETDRFDVVLLDIMMPEMSGFDLVEKLREAGAQIPIILITALDKETDKVRGLDLGADDYLVKPFNPDELSARIGAVLRRGTWEGSKRVVRAQDLEVDFERRMVRKSGVELDLSATELKLLQHLALHAGRVVPFDVLLSEVWGPEYMDEMAYLRIWVSRLRKKLGDDGATPKLVKTVPRVGYVLDPGPQEAG